MSNELAERLEAAVHGMEANRFFSTASLLREAARAIHESGWVLTKDRLPELDVPVWALFNDGGASLMVVSDTGEGWAWTNTYGHVDTRDGKWVADDAEWDDDYQPFAWHALPDLAAAPTPDQEPTQ